MSVILQKVLDFPIWVFEHLLICCKANNSVKQRLVPQGQVYKGCTKEILEIPVDTILPVRNIFKVIFKMHAKVNRKMCPTWSRCKRVVRC